MNGRAARIALTLGVGVVYFLAGKLGLHFALVNASASAIWPPAGIALAALLLFGPRLWPVIFASAFLVNVTTTGSLASSLGIAAGNTLEALIGAALVARFAGGADAFERAQDVFKFLVLAGIVSTAVSATIGVSSLALTGQARWADFGPIWLTWWLGDAAGDLIFAPPLLLVARRPRATRPARGRPVEALLITVAVLVTAIIAFSDLLPATSHGYPLGFICLPPLLWAAFRFGQRETSLLLTLLAVVAVHGTVRGQGSFALAPPSAALLLVQAFLATAAMTTLAVAALVWERKRAEQALVERDERLRLALEAGEMGTWEWTVASGNVSWSPTLEAIHGLSPGTFGRTLDAFQALVHPEDRSRMAADVHEALERGTHRTQYRIVLPDGTTRWIESRGDVFFDPATRRPRRLVGVCSDITERKRAEARLALLSELARSITSSLDLDTVLRRVVEGTQALCASDSATIFLRDADTGAMVPRQRVGPWLRAYDTLRITPDKGLGGRVMLTGRPLRTDDYLNDPRVPSDFHGLYAETGTVALMVVPILVGAEVAGLLYITNRAARPFTDEDEAVCVRLAEQVAVALQNARLFGRQEAARAEAEAANRAKDEFLAMLGHELRNPVGAISNAAHVLALADAGSGVAGRARDIIDRQVQHLGRLVDDLLDVSRVMTGKVVLRTVAVDLADTVRRAVTAYGGSRGAQHALTLDARSVWVSADLTRIEQIVTNLVSNAMKYTPAGGDIVVSVHPEGGQAVLLVRDTGLGIRPELLPRVFDLFVQGDRSLERTSGGLGIGLTLVRHLVALHGGTVEAASPGPGRGSTFTVRLPAIAVPAIAGPLVVPAPAGAPRRVLIVEDNDDAREMLREFLQLLGHEVHEARDGDAAVDLAIRVEPDLALIDIGLPGIDGYEVARRIRRRIANVRLVALTGYGQPDDRQRALAAGFDVHVVKPVDTEQLQRLFAP
jgi:PAS domain S-box-containing protein